MMGDDADPGSTKVMDAAEDDPPRGLPVLPGLLLDATDGPGWWDAYPRPGGTVALITADPPGPRPAHQGLRAVLRDRLDDDTDPAEALTAANRLARREPDVHGTALCLAVLDPLTGTLDYCTAGHPPPLIDGVPLPLTGALPLGTGTTFPVRRVLLTPGDLLTLGSAGATLTARLVPAPPLLELSLAAEPGSLRAARTATGAWLATVGASQDDVFVLQHALGELVSNAIEHGAPPTAPAAAGRHSMPGDGPHTSGAGRIAASDGPLAAGDGRTAAGDRPLRITARLTAGGEVEAVIADRGVWREPARQSVRGRGLALTAQLIGGLTVRHGPSGTVATVRHRLTRAATPSPADLTLAEPLTVTDLDGSGIRVLGDIDATTAATLQQDLLRRGRGGNLTLTVDLSGVTRLTTAGAAALHRVAEHHARQGVPLDLHTTAGTPAHHALIIAGLPHRVTAAATPRPTPARDGATSPD